MTLFGRLFLLLGLVSAGSTGVASVLLWRNAVALERTLHATNARVGGQVLADGGRVLAGDLEVTHVKIIRQKAEALQAYFADLGSTVRLESDLATQFLADAAPPADAPPLYTWVESERRVADDDAAGVFAVAPYVMYHLPRGVAHGPAVDGAMGRLRRLGGFFQHATRHFGRHSSPYLGSPLGFILGYPGNAFKDGYDPRSRPWYQAALGQPGLTWRNEPDWDGLPLITCCCPVAAPGPPGAPPAGVAALDVPLALVLGDLFNVGQLDVTRAALLDETGRPLARASRDHGVLAPVARASKSAPAPDVPDDAWLAPVTRRVAADLAADPRHLSGWHLDGPDLATSTDVDVYATVRIAADAAEPRGDLPPAGRTLDWRYVVQLPVAKVIAPLTAITGQINGATRGVSDAIAAETRRSTAAVAAILCLTLVAALTAAYGGARAVARPLVQMAGVARSVGAGDLTRRAVEAGGREVADLGRAVNGMIDALGQRDLLRDTFGRFVTPAVAADVLRHGRATAGGAKRVVTVFFSDLEGFTALSERTDADTLVMLLNEYLGAMTRVIVDAGGTVDKYVGDAVVAFWGGDGPDDPAAACVAALTQVAALADLNRAWHARGLPGLGVRVGIQTGEAVVGNVGSDLKLNYTVIGDTVNVSARLEAANKVYGTRILIGERTRLAAGDAVVAREIDLLAVVGKQEAVRVYELLGPAGGVPAPRLAGCRSYESALAACRDRRWADARLALAAARDALGPDRPTDLLADRVAAYEADPPPADWDGRVVLTHK